MISFYLSYTLTGITLYFTGEFVSHDPVFSVNADRAMVFDSEKEAGKMVDAIYLLAGFDLNINSQTDPEPETKQAYKLTPTNKSKFFRHGSR